MSSARRRPVRRPNNKPNRQRRRPRSESRRRFDPKVSRFTFASFSRPDLWLNDPAYSQRDKDGIPTHDAAGAEVTKSLRKKLEKQFAAQQTLRDKYFK